MIDNVAIFSSVVAGYGQLYSNHPSLVNNYFCEMIWPASGRECQQEYCGIWSQQTINLLLHLAFYKLTNVITYAITNCGDPGR